MLWCACPIRPGRSICSLATKMSTCSSSSTGVPSSTSARPSVERRLQVIVATAVPCVGFLIVHTLHATMLLDGRKENTTSSAFLVYIASLLIGGFLSDYFNPWILFVDAIEIGSVLTTTLFLLYKASDQTHRDRATGDIGATVFCTFVIFSVTSWLAAAKLIKKSPTISPSQQRLWWTLLTACSSMNVPLMIGTVRQIYWYVVGLSTLLLLILIALGYMYTYHSKELTRNDNQDIRNKITLKLVLRDLVFFVMSYKLWFIVILNALLLVTKWMVTDIILGTKKLTTHGMNLC